MLFLRKKHEQKPPRGDALEHKTTNNKYHRSVNWFGYIVLLFCLISGFTRWLDLANVWLSTVHYLSALAIIFFLILHSYVYFLTLGKKLVVKLFQIKAIVRLKWHLISFCLLAGIGVFIFDQNTFL